VYLRRGVLIESEALEIAGQAATKKVFRKKAERDGGGSDVAGLARGLPERKRRGRKG